MERRYRYFDLIMALFVTVLLVSNIASSAKIVDWGISFMGLPLAFDAGTILRQQNGTRRQSQRSDRQHPRPSSQLHW